MLHHLVLMRRDTHDPIKKQIPKQGKYIKRSATTLKQFPSKRNKKKMEQKEIQECKNK